MTLTREQLLERRERTRAEQHGIRIGARLQHSRWGVVDAECVWAGPRDWRVFVGAEDGTTRYYSIFAAARAAARELGHRSTEPNGWIFWGLEKRGF